jgi:TrmH family RNA methyltransferase
MDNAIKSLQNPRVKAAIHLRDQRQRTRHQRFLIDGIRELSRAIEAGIKLVDVFVCSDLCQSAESRAVLALIPGRSDLLWQVTAEVFEKLAFGHRREGIIAVAETPHKTLADLNAPPGGLVAVIERIEKPGNVGAILRSADGAGVSAVIVAEAATDLFNPNCIRASLGTVFSPRVCQATTPEAIDWLQARGANVFTADLNAERNYTGVDLAQHAAVVLGSEARGISEAWQRCAPTPIKLPMLGTADSLNVSAAAAVVFYEALRQRERATRS